MDAKGNYTFTLNDQSKAVGALGEESYKELLFTVTATDNSGAANDTGTGTIKITVRGSNEAPTLAEPATLTVTERGGNVTSNQTFSLTLTGKDDDTGDMLAYSAHLPGSDALVSTLYLFSPTLKWQVQ